MRASWAFWSGGKKSALREGSPTIKARLNNNPSPEPHHPHALNPLTSQENFRVLHVVYHSDSPLPQGPKDSPWSKISFGRHLEFLAVQPGYLPATMATTEHAHEQSELAQPLGPREGGGGSRFSSAATGVTKHWQMCQWVIPRRVCEFIGSSLYNTHSTLNNRVWASWCPTANVYMT